MRRGYKNKWRYDAAPESDGLVTVSTLDSKTNYQSAEELALRKQRGESKAIVRDLAKYGWLPGTSFTFK